MNILMIIIRFLLEASFFLAIASAVAYVGYMAYAAYDVCREFNRKEDF